MPEIESGAKIAAAREVRGVLPVGTRLRSYELTGVLGQGSFGITYRARDATLHREVAIKEYLPITLALREDVTRVVPRSSELVEEFVSGRDRFLDEARTLARLDRAPAIVKVLDFLEANGTAYMVMALVEGETLDQRLVRAGGLSAWEIDSLLQPLLYGLEEVHAAGFLHRDIKPANIIVDSQGKPTLIDFGAARAAMAGGSSALTAIFTPGYAAPEQFTSARQGPWTDIYGLSATLYNAITGNVPPNSVDRILRDTYRPLGEIQPKGFPPELLSGIDAGLAIRAGDRPQSIAGWREVFSRAAARAQSDAATAIMPRRHFSAKALLQARPVARQRALLRTGVVALVLVLIGASYYAIVERPTSVTSAVQTLTAEQLELALAERRKADLLAAEKKRLEEEAQLRAEAEAEAKRQADADLEKARQQRQKAEEDLAAFKASIEARRQAGAGQREQSVAVQQVAAEEAAQRKAEMEMMSLRQAEEEAQRKAIADAEAKRQADAALAKAQAERRRADEEARQKAEAEATKRKADEEARQKAEAEAAKRKADEEARQKAEIAAAKRKADDEMRQAAELEAKRKAEAAANEKVQAEAKARAEAGELALRLPAAERQRLQMALTSLGFDTRGNDGAFGPRSREMIAAWQKARNLPVTGYLDVAQHQTLIREAAPAVAKYDLEQKKAEDEKRKMEEEKRKAEEEAKVRAVSPLNPISFEGPWKRDRAARCESAPDNVSFNGLTVRDGKFSYTSVGEHHRETCSVQVNSDGSFRNDSCLLQMRGRFAGDQLQLFYHSPSYGQCEVSARRGE